MSDKLKILHITPSYKPAYYYGGPIVSVASLCEELVKNHHDVVVYTTSANGPNELNVKRGIIQKIDDVEVIYFKRIIKDPVHLSPSLLQTLWKKCKKYDVVHIHSWWNLVAILSALICYLQSVRIIISPRGMLSSYSINNKNISLKKIFHVLLAKRMMKKNLFHATSEREKKEIKLLLPQAEITVIPNFVSLPIHTNVRTDETPELKLLFLSRIDPKKGLDILLEALAECKIDFTLTIVGSGEINYINKLKTFAEEQNITSKISWKGSIFKNEKFDLIADHTVTILPSYDENFGNVIVESLAVGTSVLVSDQVGLAEYVLANDFGWVCETTVFSIKQSLERIHVDAEKRKRIRMHAGEKVRKDFTGENVLKQYINLYKSIV